MRPSVRTYSTAFSMIAIAALLTAFSLEAQSPTGPGLRAAGSMLGRMPIHFVQNQGVYPDHVAYYVRGRDKTLYFTPEGVTVALKDRSQSWAVKLAFVGARPDVMPRGAEPRPGVVSYFVGRPADWKAGLPTFGQVVYENLWPGIDLVYRGTVNRMKYEFIVRPGADPDRIRLCYQGATRVEATATGTLRIETPAGSFEDEVPAAWQERDGQRVPVAMAYEIIQDRSSKDVTYGFRVGPHDRTKTLVLDPAVLLFCGYVGGNDYDDNYGTAVDASGNVYVTGETESTQASFPVTVGPILTYGGIADAYVVKIDRTGTKLIYCGYIGGTDYDLGEAIAVDSAGNAYVTGYTTSDEITEQFPVTVGPDLTFNSGTTGPGDGFIAKINPAGTALLYCGYIGGAQDDDAFGVAVDATGYAYVTGYTQSNETSDRFPVIVGPDVTFNGVTDAYVAKVSIQGTSLVYCGYIGGAQRDGGWGDIVVDAAGNAYVLGETASNQTTDAFPVLVGPDLTYNGNSDVFVAKILAAGNVLAYCGYVGGAMNELPARIAVDAAGNAFLSGTTESNETGDGFPVKVGPDLTFNGPTPGFDAFVAKVNALGTALDYCGYIGGSGDDWGNGVGIDAHGNAYVSGGTESSEATFPVVVGPDLTYGGNSDGFIARIVPSGAGLDYCGYIGGTDYDESWSLAVDAAGNAYVSGDTESHETTHQFPARVGPDLTYNGVTDVFSSKVSFVHIVAGGSPRPGGSVTLQLIATDDGGRAYQVGSSLGTGPIPLGSRNLGLSPDTLLVLSVSGVLPPVFSSYAGFISSQGVAQAAIHIPNDSSLVGIRIHSAFVTLDLAAPLGVQSISDTASFTITR